MKLVRLLGLAPTTVLLTAAGARADVTPCGMAIPPGVICISGNVSDSSGGGPLAAGKVYHLSGIVTVPLGEVLTVEGGAILKFHPSAILETRGRLIGGVGAVFSSLSDDTAGGDTKKDGAIPPVPGSWGQLVVNSSPLASSLENLLARYGGSSTSSNLLSNALSTARALRAEFSASDGIQASALSGSAVNWVAFQNAGHGFDLTGGAFDLVHATAAANAGAGINGSAAHQGAVRNSIAFGNTASQIAGFAAGEVFFSNAGAAFAGIDGNISADPLFTAAASGDLSLASGSPSIDTADLATALVAVKDHREAPRILDHDLDGMALADMGAIEAAACAMTFGGEPKIATVMSFTVQGPAGIVVYALGLLGGTTFLPPFGITLFGPFGSQAILGVKPTGVPQTLPVPPDELLVDLAFGVQGVGLPFSTPGVGNLTNLYRGRVLP